MSSLLMFAFAEEKLFMRVTSTISWLFFGEEIKFIDTIWLLFYSIGLPILMIVFLFFFMKFAEKLGYICDTELVTIYKRMGEQLEETKKTNEILSKLVVKKKPNSTDDH